MDAYGGIAPTAQKLSWPRTKTSWNEGKLPKSGVQSVPSNTLMVPSGLVVLPETATTYDGLMPCTARRLLVPEMSLRFHAQPSHRAAYPHWPTAHAVFSSYTQTP